MQTKSDGSAMARAVCLVQAGIAVAFAIVIGAVWGRPQAIAALYGGAVALVPTFYFALRVLKRRSGQAPADIVGAVYRGEIGKIALTALLFWLGVTAFARQFLALIVTYAACLLAYWLVLARVAWGGTDGSD
jgi:ATP synthase protein I